ncbi:glycosyltransferase family 4 protein [Streptomyces stelliscabiei]|uniref:D-inositol 3-phosphate glycosyltransferase n=1 Tax=Streptomyces stelliscabiei TaxID=146820 RepID=A0A8I0TTS0_9ACTN|nr:glycosyltransferase family 4 protein [Streptomyces stelliscabiei]MBE1599992.1 glycosyltransferase involved in cell wall biosynthesis [Streptomyces stelliscabiei]
MATRTRSSDDVASVPTANTVPLQRQRGTEGTVEPAATTISPKIAVALHDGYYGCTSGTGFSNRAFLEVLARTLPRGRLLVMPVHISRSDPSYDPVWGAETEEMLRQAGAKVVPVPGGRAATATLAGCEALCEQVTEAARERLADAPMAQLIGLDIPFLGLGPYRRADDPFSLLLLPRSTSELASPEDRRRIRWEHKGLTAAVRGGARVASISHHMRGHLEQVYGVPRHVVVDLPNGLLLSDHEDMAPAPLPPQAEAGFLLAMGRAVESKGFEDLLEAVRILGMQGERVPHLLLAPTTHTETLTGYQQRLQTMVRDYAIDATFLPRFSPQYRSWLRSPALRGVVVPSRAEPFGRIPLEAFASGAAPVVATRAGGLMETVVDGVTGFTAEAGDPMDLTHAIRRALHISAQEREQMRERGRALLMARHDYEATIHSYLRQYVPWAMALSASSRSGA